MFSKTPVMPFDSLDEFSKWAIVEILKIEQTTEIVDAESWDGTLNIKMTINNTEVNFYNFTERLYELYEKLVVDEAKSLLSDQANELIDSIILKLRTIQNYSEILSRELVPLVYGEEND